MIRILIEAADTALQFCVFEKTPPKNNKIENMILTLTVYTVKT